MRVLTINTNNSAGGASIACIRLHNSLLQSNIEADLLMLEAPNATVVRGHNFYSFYIQQLQESYTNTSLLKKSLNKVSYHLKLNEEARFNAQKRFEQTLIAQQPEGYEVFTFETSRYHLHHHPLYKQADIIHLHWVSNGFLDYEDFFHNNTKPVVWTLHDMNPFTGGCHYSESCEGYLQNCMACPQLQGTDDPDYAGLMLQKKIKGLSALPNLTISAPSLWMFNHSKKSKVLGKFPHVHIPYGIDSNNFQTRDKEYSKQLLGIPAEKRVVLFVAESIHKKRKGYTFLLAALQSIQKDFDDIVLCAIGATNQNSKPVENFYELGIIRDEKLMSVAYSAADVFVIPSLEDNLPNTVIESLLCGTPVIGFPRGGVTEMIQDGKNGYICDQVSVESLAFQLKKMLITPNQFDTGNIRQEAVKKYDLSVQSGKYIQLYKSLLN